MRWWDSILPLDLESRQQYLLNWKVLALETEIQHQLVSSHLTYLPSSMLSPFLHMQKAAQAMEGGRWEQRQECQQVLYTVPATAEVETQLQQMALIHHTLSLKYRNRVLRMLRSLCYTAQCKGRAEATTTALVDLSARDDKPSRRYRCLYFLFYLQTGTHQVVRARNLEREFRLIIKLFKMHDSNYSVKLFLENGRVNQKIYQGFPILSAIYSSTSTIGGSRIIIEYNIISTTMLKI